MRLHDRYIFRELITSTGYCLGAFLIVGVSLIFKQELNTIHERKLTALESIAYCAASLPEIFALILPIILLIALLYTLTQHARHNEITALRAAGLSLWRICAPYFAVGLLATGLSFAINEFTVPACKRWAQEILNRHVTVDNDASPQADGSVCNKVKSRIWKFGQYDTKTTRMSTPTVSWKPGGQSWRLLSAQSGVYTNGVWTFFDVQMFKESASQANMVPAGYTNVLAVPDLDETPEQIQLLRTFTDSQTLRATGSSDLPLSVLWQLRQNQDYLTPADVNAVQTKFYGRLAMPWTCFIVVLVAIPFGAPSGRRNLFYGVAGSIFIGFAFFVLQRVSLALGINGQLPGWVAAWLPNSVFALAGTVLTFRVR